MNDVVLRPLCHAQRLGCKGGHQGAAHPQHQRYAPHHAVSVGHKIQRTIALCDRLERWQRRYRARKAMGVGPGELAHRDVAGSLQPCRQGLRISAGLLVKRQSQHHFAARKNICQHLIMVRQAADLLAHRCGRVPHLQHGFG
jgi:hypothetical protein